VPMNCSRVVFLTLAASMWIACEHSGGVTGDDPKATARTISGFQSPEDLVALPGGQAILVSEFGDMEGKRAGRLSLFVLDSEARRVLFEGGDADGVAPEWGDPACPGPPPKAFSPHGIQLSKRAGGELQLLVVQHGGRESIEFFQVEGSGDDYQVAWRGCVVAPEDTWLNSVAALPGGGFVTTNMMSRSAGGEDLAAAFQRGEATGYALEWQPGRGFEILSSSRGSMPNGIEVSKDGSRVFLNSSGEQEVRRIVRETGEVEARASGIPHLDNARWAPDGRLVVASVTSISSEAFAPCMNLAVGVCPIPFEIVAIDPVSMESEVLYRSDGTPMGGGTVGLVVGDELFVGSFAGDRILRVALD